MEPLSAKFFKTSQPPEEVSWYYVQPGYKLITVTQLFFAILCFVAILAVLVFFDPVLGLGSYWTFLIVPLDALLVGWILIALQPHRQIFYRIDEEGVFSEFRSSASPLASFADLVLGLLSSFIGLKNLFYINKHSSRSRNLDWGEIVSITENPNWKRITLQAGLYGQITLWANADNYVHVLTVVKHYVSQARKHYD